MGARYLIVKLKELENIQEDKLKQQGLELRQGLHHF
jgi:hypothetical protein